jgi:hypothetical protein
MGRLGGLVRLGKGTYLFNLAEPAPLAHLASLAWESAAAVPDK